MSRALPVVLYAGLAAVATAAVVASARAQDAGMQEGYARLLVITNFDTTEVQINEVSYPYEWIQGDMQGVLVPADFPFTLRVAASEDQVRVFRLTLDEGETRVIVVDVENMGEGGTRREREPEPTNATPSEGSADDEGEDEATEEIGYLGVSSSPRGIVYVDGESTGQRTPARRIEVEPGRHEVTIFYDEYEEMSEVKHVLIRAGVNTNVFFRYRGDQQPQAE